MSSIPSTDFPYGFYDELLLGNPVAVGHRRRHRLDHLQQFNRPRGLLPQRRELFLQYPRVPVHLRLRDAQRVLRLPGRVLRQQPGQPRPAQSLVPDPAAVHRPGHHDERVGGREEDGNRRVAVHASGPGHRDPAGQIPGGAGDLHRGTGILDDPRRRAGSPGRSRLGRTPGDVLRLLDRRRSPAGCRPGRFGPDQQHHRGLRAERGDLPAASRYRGGLRRVPVVATVERR